MYGLRLLVGVLRVRVVGLLVLLTDGVLEVRDTGGVVDVGFATRTPVVFTRLGHARGNDSLAGRPAALVHLVGVHGEKVERGTLNAARGTVEAAFDNLGM